MATFPSEQELLNAGYSRSQMQVVFAAWRTACTQLPGGAKREVCVISNGVITPSVSSVAVNTEGGAATDDLTNISTANLQDGSVVVLWQAYGNTVTVKTSAGGVGQIILANGDRVLSGLPGVDAIFLMRVGTSWYEMSFLSQDVDLGSQLTAKGQGQLGLTAKSIATDNLDLNTLTVSGCYSVSSTGQVNGPGFGPGIVTVAARSATYIVQTYIEDGNSAACRIATRRMYQETWGAWVETITTAKKDVANGYVGLDSVKRVALGHRPTGTQVGSTSNAGLLVSGINTNSFVNIIRDSADAYYGGFNIGKTRSADGSDFSAVEANDGLGIINFVGADGSVMNTYAARILAAVDGAVASSSVPGRLDFYTLATGETVAYGRWTIKNDGTFKPYTDNAYDLGVAATARLRNIYTVNAVTVGSDRRDKTEVEDSPLGLDFILKLRPVAYKMVVGDQWAKMEPETDDDGNPVFDLVEESEQVPVGRDAEGNVIYEEHVTTHREPKLCEVIHSRPGKRTHYGLLAQEVHEAVPEDLDFGGWIKLNPDDADSREALRYEELISPIIKAIQEQQEQIHALKVAIESVQLSC